MAVEVCMDNIPEAERFYLSIVILVCLVLWGYALGLVLSGKGKTAYKAAFTLLVSYLFIYQLSTLVAFYATDQDIFRIAIFFKVMAAFHTKTAALLFFSVYVREKWMIFFFLATHCLASMMIPLYLINGTLAQSLFMFTGPFQAEFGPYTYYYALTSNALFYLAAIIFIFKRRAWEKKKKAVWYMMLILAANTIVVLFIAKGSQDILSEKMHVLLLLIVLSFVCYRTPFLSKSDSFIMHADVLEGISEKVLIYDDKGYLATVHEGDQSIQLTGKASDIEKLLPKDEKGVIPEEGSFIIQGAEPQHVLYKKVPISYKGKPFGQIMVLRNITSLVRLQNELQEKNLDLSRAIEKHRFYSRISKRLIDEKERSMILEKVNATADAYIKKVKAEIVALKDIAAHEPELAREQVRQNNEYLLELTRKALEEIRGTVRKLSVSKGGLE